MTTKFTEQNLKDIVELSKNYKNLEDILKPEPNGSSGRTRFSKDYSRILYSNSLRRLQGKMQFLSVASNKFYRNRLTHSHEVVQIARTIAGNIRRECKSFGLELNLYGSDMYVIESACLAHDIGNPPFGHAGERILNDLMKDKGGYEGNAQTFRVLNKLERRFPNEEGLFLSKRTLLSVVKYYQKGESNSKFLYDSDYEIVEKIIQEADVKLRTIDAQIMDIADEIAYAAHDLEDALRLRLFTIDDLIFEFSRSTKYNSATAKLEEIVNISKEFAKKCTSVSSEDFFFFFTKELTSCIVNTLVQDVSFVKVSDDDIKVTGTMHEYEIGYHEFEKLSNGLKKLTFNCIIRKPQVLLYEKKGEKIIKDLFELYMDDEFNKELKLLPPEYRALKDTGDSNCRIICDYLSGMMDIYALETHKKYFGERALDKFH